MKIVLSLLIRLSLSSIFLLSILSCINTKNKITNRNSLDSCKYVRYDVGELISNLGCKNCHIQQILRMEDIPTFKELSKIDSLKLIDYAFIKKHKGWYSRNGDFKTARMDTLSNCEIKNIVRYIKDAGRDIPMSSQ